MQLPAPVTDPTDWAAEIGDAAEGEMNCTATFYTSAKVTGSAPTLTQIFDPCRARVALLPTHSISVNASGEYVETRDYRVQIPRSTYASFIPTGATVRISGGDDPVLPDIALKVRSAVNGGRMAVRTVMCIAEIVVSPAVS